MKIGIYDPYLDTLSGGEKYMLSMASCLSKDNDVYIFWNDEEDIRKRAKSKLGIDLENVKFLDNIFSAKTSFVNRFRASRKFDKIIYLSDGSIPVLGCSLFVHFQFPVEYVRNTYKNRFKIKRAEAVICNSFFTKVFIDKKFGINSVVLYPPASSFSSSKKENIILHVGRLGLDSNGVNFKKQDVMIDVFKKMIDSGLKNWKFLLIIGTKIEDSEKLSSLRELSKGYPIEILENVGQDALSEYYSKSKIYWHATGFGEDVEKYPEKAEHFGMSTVEAMSAGVVPVAINAGGQKEILREEDGFLWDSLRQLEEYTLRLINSPELLLSMSKNSIQRSMFFTGDRFCKEIKEIIK